MQTEILRWILISGRCEDWPCHLSVLTSPPSRPRPPAGSGKTISTKYSSPSLPVLMSLFSCFSNQYHSSPPLSFSPEQLEARRAKLDHKSPAVSDKTRSTCRLRPCQRSLLQAWPISISLSVIIWTSLQEQFGTKTSTIFFIFSVFFIIICQSNEKVKICF